LLPRRLSGGERQRVGLARALAADPPLLLMDEPFGALDPLTRRRIQDEFRDLRVRLGKTVVLVTHDVPEALRLADAVAVMDAGRVLQHAPPREIREQPREGFVRDLVSAALA
jgi:osmoprotectant transport system ATP-binding protein